jgi:hypothetical protein
MEEGGFARVPDGLHRLQPMQSVGFLRERRKTDRPPQRIGLQGFADQGDHVDEAVGVSPLVVVPANNLDLIADHLGER